MQYKYAFNHEKNKIADKKLFDKMVKNIYAVFEYSAILGPSIDSKAREALPLFFQDGPNKDLILSHVIFTNFGRSRIKDSTKIIESFTKQYNLVPNCVCDMFKNRGGRWTNIRIWE